MLHMASFQMLSVKHIFNPPPNTLYLNNQNKYDLKLNLTHKYKYGKRIAVHHQSGCISLPKEGDGGAGRAHKPEVYSIRAIPHAFRILQPSAAQCCGSGHNL